MDAPVIEMLIPLMAFVSVMAIGSSVLISRQQKKQVIDLRLGNTEYINSPNKKTRTKPMQFLAQMGNLVSHGHSKKSLNEQLLRAGYLGPLAPAVYTGVKILLFGVGLVVMAIVLVPTDLAGNTKMTLTLLGATLLFFIPNFFVYVQLKKRQTEIHNHLPDAVDLLEVCVTSGIGLDMAWNIVSDEVRDVSPVLSGAMSLTNFEINLGISRVEAMKHMAERTGVVELSSLAAILIQTERFGTSIADALGSFATSLREERSYSAEESAEKMAVKLIFPMVLFIFPALLITLAGPAVISLLDSFK